MTRTIQCKRLLLAGLLAAGSSVAMAQTTVPGGTPNQPGQGVDQSSSGTMSPSGRDGTTTRNNDGIHNGSSTGRNKSMDYSGHKHPNTGAPDTVPRGGAAGTTGDNMLKRSEQNNGSAGSTDSNTSNGAGSGMSR